MSAASRRWRRWARRLTAVGAVTASTALVAVAVGELRAMREDTAAADLLTEAARHERQERLDTVARLEASIAEARGRAEQDRTDASSIDDAVVLLEQMRADIATAQKATEEAEAGRRERQARVDQLERCGTTLRRAAGALDAGNINGSALNLEVGRADCQRALALANGDTGAVHPYDFPDPHVIAAGGAFYAFGTNGPAGTVQVIRSGDLRDWTVLEPALAAVAIWAQPGWTWAPAVAKVGGGFVLYYTVRAKDSGKQCISTATSATPEGPYVDDSLAPLVCQVEIGGSIDPSPYRDEIGFLHLSWKSEDETVGGRATLWTQLLTGDGRALFGPATVLLEAERTWEHGTIENPSMAKVGDTWLLLYSANRWNTAEYTMAYATCATAVGPCARPEHAVIRASNGREHGPGGGQFFHDGGGRLHVAYAAWDAGQVGYPNSRRLHLATADLVDEGLVLG